MKQHRKALASSRRNMLTKIIKHPQSLLAQEEKGENSTPVFREVDLTSYTSAMEHYWQQSKESLLPSAEQLAATQIAPLERLFSALPAKHPQAQQIARLLSQAYQLAGILVSHRNNFRQCALYCQRAVQLAEEAQDSTLLVAALVKLGVTFYYADQPQQAGAIYRQALTSCQGVSPLLQCSLSMKRAAVFAQFGQEQEAMRLLEEVYRAFPSHPERDPAFLYADCGVPSLSLWDGLTHLALGESNAGRSAAPSHLLRAWETFAPFGGAQPSLVISERNRLEILNHQAITATYLGDLERVEAYLIQGILGARHLGSSHRYAEAIECYRLARTRWPNEIRIQRLASWFLDEISPNSDRV